MHISSQLSKIYEDNNIFYVHIIDNIYIINIVMNIRLFLLLCGSVFCEDVCTFN